MIKQPSFEKPPRPGVRKPGTNTAELIKNVKPPCSDDNTEFTFAKAYDVLLNKNKIVTSKSSGYSYKAEHKDKKVKLKFFNPVISIWQPCNYFSSEEILDKWYISTEE